MSQKFDFFPDDMSENIKILCFAFRVQTELTDPYNN